ncbi:hypothetical protein [Nocardia suismassiliense]|uniref:hypothetical protein n=1 Tax=Nocardia suismassiliense TaxID=2077092 RepID=UPI000D1E2EAE|nr:hypothetical protein [Nocardia suismassiliense]
MARRSRTATILAAVAPLATALIFLPAAPAQAAEGDLSCSATIEFTFDPALRANGSSKVTISGDFTACSSPNGKHADLGSGRLQGTGSATATAGGFNPCRLLISVQGDGTIGWAPGGTSTFDWEITHVPFTGGIELSANVTGGELNGDAITLSEHSATSNPGCDTEGLSTLSVHAQVAFN